MNACVFVGPTLPLRDARVTLDALYLPPVQQGDVYRAVLRHRPRAIGIVDGYFQHVPSVWHKEILWAMTEGVHVFGSASMGALRAAELAPFGMRGVGQIFEAFRGGVFEPYTAEAFEDDDEVAVVHGTGDSGYAALSEAMVNIRATLAAAARASVISPATRDALVGIAKALFYPDRSWERLLRCAAARSRPGHEVEALRAWLLGGHIDQKRDDALAMLAEMRTFLAQSSAPARTAYVFQRSEMWERAIAHVATADERDGQPHGERDAILEELRLDPPTYDEARRAGLLRWAGLREWDRAGLAPDPRSRQAAEMAFRSRFAMVRRSDINRWMAENDLDDAAREQLMVDEARLLQLDQTLGALADTQVVAHLRATGQYARYAGRARAKAETLDGAGGGQGHVDEVTRFRLTAWYFEHRLGGQIPDDLDEYVARLGFAGADAFYQALWREYRYQTGGARSSRPAPGVGPEARGGD